MRSMLNSISIFLLVGVITAAGSSAKDIRSTKHNLGVRGLDTMSRICVFCHTPHEANPISPMWNRPNSGQIYRPYSSSTLQATTGQPNGDTKLCLSCHDGTIAQGRIFRGDKRIREGEPLRGSLSLGTDLSDDHPVSFHYSSGLAGEDRELVDPVLLQGTPVNLDNQGFLQCTTCHDPHFTPYPKMLVLDNFASGLCVACHDKRGWSGSSHATSTASLDVGGSGPWIPTDYPTVAANGCLNCHSTHSAVSGEWLLNSRKEEELCLDCHNGSMNTADVASEFRKRYRHPVTAFLGIHDPNENPTSMSRHVECQDCHDPHAANAANPFGGVSGVSASGGKVSETWLEHEVCFKCHSDGSDVPSPSISRQIFDRDLARKFDPSNPSLHPVLGPGMNTDVPSLRPPLTTTSTITCVDCHQERAHGSDWQFLLRAEYRTAPGTRESSQNYALCYECHDRASILNNVSFSFHREHLEDGIPCSVCHDPHGISSAKGNAFNNSHLINFDTTIVQPDPATGKLEFEDLGQREGKCYLTCHGVVHSPLGYPFDPAQEASPAVSGPARFRRNPN